MIGHSGVGDVPCLPSYRTGRRGRSAIHYLISSESNTHDINAILSHGTRPKAHVTTVPQPAHLPRHILIDKSQPSAIMKPLLADYTSIEPLTIFRRNRTMNDNRFTTDFPLFNTFLTNTRENNSLGYLQTPNHLKIRPFCLHM